MLLPSSRRILGASFALLLVSTACSSGGGVTQQTPGPTSSAGGKSGSHSGGGTATGGGTTGTGGMGGSAVGAGGDATGGTPGTGGGDAAGGSPVGAGGTVGTGGTTSGGGAGGAAVGGQGTGGGAAGSSATSDAIQIIVEPSDHAAAVIAAIKGAQKSVHMTMYLLTNTEGINALVARHKAGVDVKVLLNKTFPPGGGETNASAYSTLQSAGVPVEWAPATFTYTHEKCLIIDGSVAWIMTMNLTKTSADANREYLAVDTDAEDVAEAGAIFDADWAGTTPTLAGKLLVAPVNAREGILALIASATSTIDVEGEELSETMITNALANKSLAGLKVRVVLTDSSSSTAESSAVATLKKYGVGVVGLGNPTVHAKAIVVDGVRAYVGSANFTAGSLQYNREVGIVTANTTEIAKVATTIAQDFAAGSPM